MVVVQPRRMLGHITAGLARPKCRIVNRLNTYCYRVFSNRLNGSGDATNIVINGSPKIDVIKIPLTINDPANLISPPPKKRVLSIALVGRPNTGKSTLFNRLTGTNLAIVTDVPGTTRDRKEEKGTLACLPLSVIDTGGLDDRGAINTQIQQQVQTALTQADVVIFMLDARAGVTALDEHFAKWIRRTLGQIQKVESEKMESSKRSMKTALNNFHLPKEIIVIANKAEGALFSDKLLDCVSDALKLGLGEPIPMSASHG